MPTDCWKTTTHTYTHTGDWMGRSFGWDHKTEARAIAGVARPYNFQNVSETVETRILTTCSSVDCLSLKTNYMPNKLLHIVSTEKYKYQTQVIMGIATYVRVVDNGVGYWNFTFVINLTSYVAVSMQKISRWGRCGRFRVVLFYVHRDIWIGHC
jgi:hypothetical protein